MPNLASLNHAGTGRSPWGKSFIFQLSMLRMSHGSTDPAGGPEPRSPRPDRRFRSGEFDQRVVVAVSGCGAGVLVAVDLGRGDGRARGEEDRVLGVGSGGGLQVRLRPAEALHSHSHLF